MMRKDNKPAIKKARKSAAVLVAESRIEGLEHRLDNIESLLWKIALGTIGGVISAVGVLALIVVGLPHHVGM